MTHATDSPMTNVGNLIVCTPAQMKQSALPSVPTARADVHITFRQAYEYGSRLLALRQHCCRCLGEPRVDTQLVQVIAYSPSYLRTNTLVLYLISHLGALV